MKKPDGIIDYAPMRPGGRSRRRIGWIILAVAVVLGIVGGLWQWRREQAMQARRQWADAMYALAQSDALRDRDNALKACGEYTASAGRVIFEQEPAEVKRLLASMDGYRRVPDDLLAGPFAAGHFPDCWMGVLGSLYYPDADCPGGFAVSPAGIAFLHDRTDRDGNQRTVRVAVGMITEGKPVLMPLIVRLNNGKGAWPRQQAMGVYLGAKDVLRIYAGQVDSNDASRFTIEYELNGTRGTIDGWLDAVEEQIRLKPRTGTVDVNRPIPLWIPGELHSIPTTQPDGMPW